MIRKSISALVAMLAILSLTACGESVEDKQAAADAARSELLQESSSNRLPNGASGSCTGDNDKLSAVRLTTADGHLTVNVDGFDEAQGTTVLYDIMFTSDTGDMSQVGLKTMNATNENLQYVYNFTDKKQENYGSWDNRMIHSGTFSNSIPVDKIMGGDVTAWKATLSVDGIKVATCPSDGTSAMLRVEE